MLAIWLLAENSAPKTCGLASNVLLVLLVISIGLVTRADDAVALGTIFVALVLALMLAVHSWNVLTSSSVPMKTESGAVANDV